MSDPNDWVELIKTIDAITSSPPQAGQPYYLPGQGTKVLTAEEAEAEREALIAQEIVRLGIKDDAYARYQALRRAAVGEEGRLSDAGTFALEEHGQTPAIWGFGQQVLAADGEGWMIVGHQGTGKTTLAQQFHLHRLGLREGPLVGLPVKQDDRPWLYLAMDRPRQAARSMYRMVSGLDDVGIKKLNEGLKIWQGPLPVNILQSPSVFADWAHELVPGLGGITVDSVKDLAPGISKDEIGAALNMAWQEVIARGVQLCLLHHERKAGAESKRLHRLDDVYGSTWLTSGLGSVIVLNGNPGDSVIELRHLKQPAEEVGPVNIRHDHDTGTTVIPEHDDELSVLAGAQGSWVETGDIIERLGGRTSGDKQRIRRRLRRLAEEGLIERTEGTNSATGRSETAWTITSSGLSEVQSRGLASGDGLDWAQSL